MSELLHKSKFCPVLCSLFFFFLFFCLVCVGLADDTTSLKTLGGSICSCVHCVFPVKLLSPEVMMTRLLV